ncbi:hypothetical protein OAO87_01180 [bacterium]|nr:hypothetical protein [bacterium]
MRCGAAGTLLHRDQDAPFRSSSASMKGLNDRMTQYHFLPNVGRIYAALRVRKQLVALPTQRTAGDEGSEYNVDRGNQTEVLAREKHLHYVLDQAGLRWQQDKRNELFQPKSSVMELVDQMRKVQGLQMILFDKTDWREDAAYLGGIAPPKLLATTETTQRKVPERQSKDQSLVIRLSKGGINELRAGNPTAYVRLLYLMRAAFREQTGQPPPPPPAKPAAAPARPAQTVNALFNNAAPRQQAAAARAVLQAVPRETRAARRAREALEQMGGYDLRPRPPRQS